MNRIIQDIDYRRKADALLQSDYQLDQIVGAFCTMDADVVFATTEGIRRFNNTTSEEFYDQLTALFEYCERKGDREFKVFSAQCKNAECRACDIKSFTFVADRTGNHISLRFDLEKGKVVRFKECSGIRTPVAMKPGSKTLYLSQDPF